MVNTDTQHGSKRAGRTGRNGKKARMDAGDERGADKIGGEMKKLILLMVLLLPIQTYAAEPAYVNSDVGVNLRAAHSEQGAVIEVLPFATSVMVFREYAGSDRTWSKVEWDGRSGWVASEYLQPENPLSSMDYKGVWRITAYAYTGSPCANGNYPTADYTIACNSLPFGTRIYIDGIGFRTVEDRGPDSMGDAWCDLYLGDEAECWAWGNQYREVWVIE